MKTRAFLRILPFLFLSALGADSSRLVIATSLFAFSPNSDGIQDQIEIRFIEIPGALEPPADYLVRVESDKGVVRTIRADQRWIRPRRSIGNLFLPFAQTVRPLSFPESILWDGRDDTGKWLADGTYRISVTAFVQGGQPMVSNIVTVELSTRKPVLTLSADVRFVTRAVAAAGKPADSIQGEFAINQTAQADQGTIFTGRIINASGDVIEERTWQGALSQKITWNGRTSKGELAAWGCYSYVLEARTPSGNVSRETLSGLVVGRFVPQIDIQPDEAFSPNGDGQKDKIQFLVIFLNQALRSNIKSFRLQILTTEKGDLLYESAPQKVLPGVLVWDGKTSQGSFVKDGIYDAKLVVETTQGNIESALRSFRVGTAPPAVSLSSSAASFTPDGRGEEEPIVFHVASPDTRNLESWAVRVLCAPNTAGHFQKLIRTWQGQTLPEEIVWNGLSDTGEPIESLENFVIQLEARDRSGNVSRPERLRVTSKVLFRPAQPGVRNLFARIPVQSYFDPNGSLTAEGEVAVSEIVKSLQRYQRYNIHLYMHSGTIGREETNLENSENRGLTLFKRMEPEWKGRIDFQGLGESEALSTAPEDFPQYRNERIELQLYLPQP